jgi:hypothetical protein
VVLLHASIINKSASHLYIRDGAVEMIARLAGVYRVCDSNK